LDFHSPLSEFFEVELPKDFDSLGPMEQERAKRLRSIQSLYKIYDVASFMTNIEMYVAKGARKTLGGQITHVVESVFRDREPYIQSLLIAAQDNWEQLVKHTEHEQTPCPLSY
jgi:hypothetical protein